MLLNPRNVLLNAQSINNLSNVVYSFIVSPLVTLHIEKPSKINPLPMIGKFDANEVKEYEKLV